MPTIQRIIQDRLPRLVLHIIAHIIALAGFQLMLLLVEDLTGEAAGVMEEEAAGLAEAAGAADAAVDVPEAVHSDLNQHRFFLGTWSDFHGLSWQHHCLLCIKRASMLLSRLAT